MKDIINYLEVLIPNPVCELNYSHDYELLISVMLSAQTTDVMVNQVTKILYNKYPDLLSLSKADITDIENIIKPVGTYKRKSEYVKSIALSLIKHGYNYIPNDRSFLESLNGVGRKTVNVVLSILYNEPFIAVDTHVKRVSIRLGLANKNDSLVTIENKLYKCFKGYNMSRLHHQLLLFGRYYCKAKKPLCTNCKLIGICKKDQN